jgi:hypothetical protein
MKSSSFQTLGELLLEAGFMDVRFERVGRLPTIAKAMIAVAMRPK